MKWETVKLGDVTDSCLGKMLDQNKNKGTFQPYLANVNVRWGSFDLDNLSEMRFEEHEQERYGLRYGDLVICEGGEPGRCAIWKDELPNMKIQKALHRVRVHDDMDYRYLFYWFLYAGKRGVLEQYFTGATIKHMPGDKLKTIEIEKPPLHIQKHVADILSAYDALIENNQKQIKLLEEAAQRLYKEWFIDLRFPGYETTPVVDGVPKGWEKTTVNSLIGKVQRTKQVMTSDYLNEGEIPIIDQSRDFIAGYTNDKESLVNIGIPVIVFGDHTRVLKYITFPFAKGADGTQLIVSICERMPQPLLYCSLVNIDLSNYHYARHFKYLKSEEILVPTLAVAKKFDRITSPLFDQIQSVREIATKAAQARDCLLPKLMSGEIEV
ncbi:MAG: restriction endonuclease subunit S [Oscillospiraceae bacterium]|nr:restriction endonuclease subunit S [Oscillospiraceae bacterium]